MASIYGPTSQSCAKTQLMLAWKLEGLLLITGPSKGRVTSCLLNPFTGSMLEYPNISRLYNTHARSEIQPTSIIFGNSTSFTILVIALKFMAFAKIGYQEWKVISLGLGRHHPCVFFLDCLYCLSVTWGLLPIELEENPKELVECRKRILITGPPCPLTIRGVESYYLVESDGQLLAVLGSCGPTHADIYFRIFQVVNWEITEDGSSCGEMISLVPVRNIGNRALFIHPWHGGISISTVVLPCFLPNSIYFYEGGVSSPKIYSLYNYTQPFLPELSIYYRPIQNEQFLVSRRFSPFLVAATRCKGHGVCRCFET